MITQYYKICTSSLSTAMMANRFLFKFRNNQNNFIKNLNTTTNRASSSSTSRIFTDQQRQNSAAAIPTPAIISSSSTSGQNYSIGKTYSNFLCTKIEAIPDFNMHAYVFRHEKVGSEFLYLHRDDTNNVFSINFRTTPFDSSGLPHILEHLVLCGSKKYPIRDPFFKMLNRSVATFMNAMTGPDYTMYPFSTMNEIDFHNLQKIYLDAVFRPNLHYMDFLQEGWRLEHSNNQDKKSDIQIKGVVYNEMKGAFSDNSSIFYQQLLNSILPDTYGYVSGGNPLEIPKLTYDDLVKFHRKYYHPSNARFFCYGNFNLNKTLEYVDGEYLSQYDAINTSYSRTLNHKKWLETKNVHVFSRYDNMGAQFDRQNQISISLLMSDITQNYETFLMYVISELLTKGPNSYFYKSLIEPNFSGGYNQVTGYTTYTKDTFFTVGLQDLRVDDFSRVQQIFDTTIQNAIDNGFEKDHVDSVLHSIELQLKHQTPKFGLGLLFNLTPIFNHEGDILESLKVNTLINKLRKNLAENPKYLQGKIEKYFKNNTHKLILTMSPDEQYETRFQEAEQMLIKEKLSKLTEEDRRKIYENGIELEKIQNTQQDINILPCLTMSDVQKSPDTYELNVIKVKSSSKGEDAVSIPTQICTVDTNRISYVKLLFGGNHLDDEQVKLIPLFTYIITEFGTKNHNYREFDKLITSKTSGINFELYFNENIYDNSTYNLGILCSTYALEENISTMFDLIEELLCNFDLIDEERFRMLIETYISNLSIGITQSGHLYAMQSSNGLVTNAEKLKSILCGIEHIDYMRNLIANTQNNYKELMNNLQKLGRDIFHKTSLRTAINTSEEISEKLIQNYEGFIDKLPKKDVTNEIKKIEFLKPSCQHYVMNIPVNYCAKSFPTVAYTHRDHPTIRILSKILRSKYLLPVVRERNGAYGAGAKLNSNGIFNFYSYRDPNSHKTLQIFDDTYKWLCDNFKKSKKGVINDETLFEAKLGVLQELDMPQSPGSKGSDFFLYGISQEMQQKYRQRVLNVTLDELKSITDKYFKVEPSHYGKCVLGPENNELKPRKNEKWTTINTSN